MTKHPRWESLDLSHLERRLLEVKQLIEQATAVAMAQETNRITTISKLHRDEVEERRANAKRRQYR